MTQIHGVKLLLEMNTMMRSGFDPAVKRIAFVVHMIYSGLNEATARVMVFAGVPGYTPEGYIDPDFSPVHQAMLDTVTSFPMNRRMRRLHGKSHATH